MYRNVATFKSSIGMFVQLSILENEPKAGGNVTGRRCAIMCNGLQTNSNGLHPNRDGFQPTEAKRRWRWQIYVLNFRLKVRLKTAGLVPSSLMRPRATCEEETWTSRSCQSRRGSFFR